MKACTFASCLGRGTWFGTPHCCGLVPRRDLDEVCDTQAWLVHRTAGTQVNRPLRKQHVNVCVPLGHELALGIAQLDWLVKVSEDRTARKLVSDRVRSSQSALK